MSWNDGSAPQEQKESKLPLMSRGSVLKRFGAVLIGSAVVCFLLARYVPWEPGYALGVLFMLPGLVIIRGSFYGMKQSDAPGPGGAEYVASVRQVFKFDFQTIPLYALLMIGAYLALGVWHSMPAFFIFVVVIFGLLLFSRWLGYKMVYRSAQYASKSWGSSTTNDRRKSVIWMIFVIAMMAGVGLLLGGDKPSVTPPAVTERQIQNEITFGTSTLTPNGILYRNEKFGFDITLPSSWVGFSVNEESQDSGIIGFNIRDQKNVFKVVRLTVREYEECKKGALCAIRFLTQNNEYVFGLTFSHDYTDSIVSAGNLVGPEVWDFIVGSFNLVPTDSEEKSSSTGSTSGTFGYVFTYYPSTVSVKEYSDNSATFFCYTVPRYDVSPEEGRCLSIKIVEQKSLDELRNQCNTQSPGSCVNFESEDFPGTYGGLKWTKITYGTALGTDATELFSYTDKGFLIRYGLLKEDRENILESLRFIAD